MAPGTAGVKGPIRIFPLTSGHRPGLEIVATFEGLGRRSTNAKTGRLRVPWTGGWPVRLRDLPVGIDGKGPFWTKFDGSRVEEPARRAEVALPGPSKKIPWLLAKAESDRGQGGISKVAD